MSSELPDTPAAAHSSSKLARANQPPIRLTGNTVDDEVGVPTAATPPPAHQARPDSALSRLTPTSTSSVSSRESDSRSRRKQGKPIRIGSSKSESMDVENQDSTKDDIGKVRDEIEESHFENGRESMDAKVEGASSENSEKSKTVKVKKEAPDLDSSADVNAQKFAQVEDELEAMFAGVEDVPIKKEAKTSKETKKSTPKETKKKQTTSSATKKKTPTGNPRGRPPNSSKKQSKAASKVSPQEALLSKFQGPFVHVEGGMQSPSFSNVINGPLDQISAARSPSKGINETELRKRVVDSSAGPTCTLDPAYDARKPDELWICVFCKQQSHTHRLGDLFGPYSVSGEVISATATGAAGGKAKHGKKDLAAKFVIDGDANRKKRKRKNSNEHNGTEAAKENEVWFHEDCVCWLPSITLIGTRLFGLDEAILGAASKSCALCKVPGCTLCCIHPGCRDTAHFHCAQENGWSLDQDNFEARCDKHKP